MGSIPTTSTITILKPIVYHMGPTLSINKYNSYNILHTPVIKIDYTTYVNSTYVNSFLKKYVREWHIMKYGRIYVRELII